MNLLSLKDQFLLDYFTGTPAKIPLNATNKIAVVGSSGNLLTHRNGGLIDDCDMVIRMNAAPTRNFEPHVGSKTTIRIVAHNAVNSNLAGMCRGLRYLVIWGAEQHYVSILPRVRELKRKFPSLTIYRLSQEAMKLNDEEFEVQTGVNRLASGAWLSTGWFALYLALNLLDIEESTPATAHIDKIVMGIGFGCAERIAGANYHYWEKTVKEAGYMMQNQQARKGHRFLTEMQIFEKWCQSYPLVFI